MPRYTASCHCGRVALDFDGTIDRALSCNCSMCSRKGSLLWFLPRERVELKTPDEAAATYTFNRHLIRHRFCAVCGIHPYGEGTDPGGRATAAINLRCVENLDLSTVPVQHFDGRAL